MKIEAREIQEGQRLRIRRGYKSYRILNKVKETAGTITFHVKCYDGFICEGDYIEKEVTYRKKTIVESREDSVGTKYDQLHRIKKERLNDIIERGLELFKVKKLSRHNHEGYEIGDYVFAFFNGVNWETEGILDDGTINAIPPSKNSDKPQISGWSNAFGGFEDFYEKVDMSIINNLLV